MIEVFYRARTGNHLFQYCFGRILAEELGYQLQATPIPHFDGTAASVEGHSYEEPVWNCPEATNPAEIIADRTPRRIVVRGYMQQYRYLHPYRHRIRQWAEIGQCKVLPEPDALVAHIRLGDYAAQGWVLSPNYFHAVIAREKFSRLYIVTDEPESPYLKGFERYAPTMVTGSSIESLRFIRCARRIVLSQSTYSWWGAFLSDAERIYYPLPRRSLWTPGRSLVDLRVHDPRYIYVTGIDTLPATKPIEQPAD